METETWKNPSSLCICAKGGSSRKTLCLLVQGPRSWGGKGWPGLVAGEVLFHVIIEWHRTKLKAPTATLMKSF